MQTLMVQTCRHLRCKHADLNGANMQTFTVQTCRHLRWKPADICAANVQTFNEVQTSRFLWCRRTDLYGAHVQQCINTSTHPNPADTYNNCQYWIPACIKRTHARTHARTHIHTHTHTHTYGVLCTNLYHTHAYVIFLLPLFVGKRSLPNGS